MLAITLIYCKSALSRSLQERIRLSNIDGPLGSPLPAILGDAIAI